MRAVAWVVDAECGGRGQLWWLAKTRAR